MTYIAHSIRSIIIYIITGLTFLIVGPILLLIILIQPSKISAIIIPFCKLMVFLFGCRVICFGKIPENQNFVIMANHVSFLDVFAIPSIFPTTKKFSAIAASKNFKIPIYSTFLKKLRVISIDRKNREQAIKGIRQAENILKDNYDIVILPEGTRTLTGELGSFKKGGFHLAQNTQANILPIVTKGLFKIKPRKGWLIKPGLINIYVGSEIETQNKTIDELLKETELSFTKLLTKKNNNEKN